MRNTHTTIAAATASCCAALVLSACGGQTVPRAEQSSPTASESASAEPSVPPQEILDAFDGYFVDYSSEGLGPPAELATYADVVVIATIEGVHSGRIEGAETMQEPGALRNTALEVTVDSVQKGNLTPGERMWIELPIPPEDAEDALVPGLEIAAYLKPAKESSADYPMGTTGSQIPDGAQLWELAHLQGFVVQYRPSEGTVTPLVDEIDRDETVEEAVPSSSP